MIILGNTFCYQHINVILNCYAYFKKNCWDKKFELYHKIYELRKKILFRLHLATKYQDGLRHQRFLCVVLKKKRQNTFQILNNLKKSLIFVDRRYFIIIGKVIF